MRTYSYGAKAPTQNAELVNQLLSLAHRYQNKLVEIEKNRRDRYRKITGEHPEVAALVEPEQKYESIVSALRKGETVSTDLTLAEAKKELDIARKATRSARRKVAKLPEYEPRIRTSDDKANKLGKEARNKSGLKNCWGTYQVIDDAIRRGKEKPQGPQFKRWDWSGQVAVHVQNREMCVGDILSGKDNWIRLSGEGKPHSKTAFRNCADWCIESVGQRG